MVVAGETFRIVIPPDTAREFTGTTCFTTPFGADIIDENLSSGETLLGPAALAVPVLEILENDLSVAYSQPSPARAEIGLAAGAFQSATVVDYLTDMPPEAVMALDSTAAFTAAADYALAAQNHVIDRNFGEDPWQRQTRPTARIHAPLSLQELASRFAGGSDKTMPGAADALNTYDTSRRAEAIVLKSRQLSDEYDKKLLTSLRRNLKRLNWEAAADDVIALEEARMMAWMATLGTVQLAAMHDAILNRTAPHMDALALFRMFAPNDILKPSQILSPAKIRDRERVEALRQQSLTLRPVETQAPGRAGRVGRAGDWCDVYDQEADWLQRLLAIDPDTVSQTSIQDLLNKYFSDVPPEKKDLVRAWIKGHARACKLFTQMQDACPESASARIRYISGLLTSLRPFRVASPLQTYSTLLCSILPLSLKGFLGFPLDHPDQAKVEFRQGELGPSIIIIIAETDFMRLYAGVKKSWRKLSPARQEAIAKRYGHVDGYNIGTYGGLVSVATDARADDHEDSHRFDRTAGVLSPEWQKENTYFLEDDTWLERLYWRILVRVERWIHPTQSFTDDFHNMLQTEITAYLYGGNSTDEDEASNRGGTHDESNEDGEFMPQPLRLLWRFLDPQHYGLKRDKLLKKMSADKVQDLLRSQAGFAVQALQSAVVIAAAPNGFNRLRRVPIKNWTRYAGNLIARGEIASFSPLLAAYRRDVNDPAVQLSLTRLFYKLYQSTLSGSSAYPELTLEESTWLALMRHRWIEGGAPATNIEGAIMHVNNLYINATVKRLGFGTTHGKIPFHVGWSDTHTVWQLQPEQAFKQVIEEFSLPDLS